MQCESSALKLTHHLWVKQSELINEVSVYMGVIIHATYDIFLCLMQTTYQKDTVLSWEQLFLQ